MAIICPVCIEPLVVSSESQVVSPPCGHVFHSQCLTNWLSEKSSCPTCRNKVKDGGFKRLYLEFGTLSNGHLDQVASYVCQVESISFELKMKQMEMAKYKEKALLDEEKKKGLRAEVSKLEDKVRRVKSDYIDTVNAQENMLKEMRSLRDSLKETEKLKQDLEEYKRLDSILHGSVDSADSILRSHDMETDNLIMLVSSFKAAFEEAKQTVMKKDKIIQRLTTDNIGFKSKFKDLSSQLSTQERVIETYKKKFSSFNLSACNSVNSSTSDHCETSMAESDGPSQNGLQVSPTSEHEPFASSCSSQGPSPQYPRSENFKKFALKRKQDFSPMLNRKLKIVSSRLKRPQNPT